MKLKFRLLFLALSAVPLIASAHHSAVEYDNTVVEEISGTLTGVQWRNPHVLLTVRVENSRNQLEDWELLIGQIYGLERSGLTRDLFVPGTDIRAAGSPSRTRNAMRPTNILLQSGDEVAFSNASPRWTDNAIDSTMRNDIVDRSELGLFRVWSLDSSQRANYGNANRTVATARFLEADNEDLLESNYALDPCEPQGMPGIMLNPLPIRFIERENQIELRLTPFAVVRTIDLDGQRRDASDAPSIFGVSTGKWINGSLEVHTSDIDWPYFDDAGRPLSTSAEVSERYEISDDGNRLTYTQTITDPLMLAESVTVSWNYIDIGEEAIQPLFCE